MPSPLGPLTPGSSGSTPGGSFDSASIRKRLAIEETDDESDVEEGQIGDREGDESAWVVDTQPRKLSKRKRKAMAKEHGEDAQDQVHDSPLPSFMAVDTGGRDASESAARDDDNAAASDDRGPPGLLLPDHVQVQQRRNTQADSTPPPPPLDDPDAEGHMGDFTQLDADTSGMTRYYQAAEAQERKQLRVCEICGEKGHVKRECSHLLCASCGATDEHTTRDCPVGVSCFRCGQRGHRRNECTVDLRRGGQHRSRDCARCGSLNHNESTCPTYWRIYVYVDEDEWQDFRARKASDMEQQREEEGGRLRRRRADSDMDTDDDDDDDDDDRYAPRAKYAHHRQDWDPAQRWCYNCTAKGTHWGDDCPLPRRAHGRNGEPSIFSEFISMSGPFAYRLAPPPTQRPTASATHPTADMYDVSVGPNTSMHFAGGASGASRRPLSIEEEVDRIFARAPRGSRGRVERGRDYQPPSNARSRGYQQSPPPVPQTHSSSCAYGSNSQESTRTTPLTHSNRPPPTTPGHLAAQTAGSNLNRKIRGTATAPPTHGNKSLPVIGGGNTRVKEHSTSWAAASDDGSDDDEERANHPKLTSRQLQSQRDKAAHQQRVAEQKQRKGEAAFGPFSLDEDEEPSRRRRSSLAIDLDWAPPVKESNKSKKNKSGKGAGGAGPNGQKAAKGAGSSSSAKKAVKGAGSSSSANKGPNGGSPSTTKAKTKNAPSGKKAKSQANAINASSGKKAKSQANGNGNRIPSGKQPKSQTNGNRIPSGKQPKSQTNGNGTLSGKQPKSQANANSIPSGKQPTQPHTGKTKSSTNKANTSPKAAAQFKKKAVSKAATAKAASHGPMYKGGYD